ncbi:uncharacterized protein LOC120162226 [Hibiscus syriacus]|uniref:uncharacterized protein LOC120162226 n=1 Tax=Hibiscus syriacus TaxID=106335 RepID=UPI0019243D41|nr:uncharacterized protein LOC120162226 [Hibiscus syriacus]
MTGSIVSPPKPCPRGMYKSMIYECNQDGLNEPNPSSSKLDSSLIQYNSEKVSATTHAIPVQLLTPASCNGEQPKATVTLSFLVGAAIELGCQGFISQILKALQLPHAFIAWIEACFTGARFSISFNGTLIGYFKGARGLRQGDPLSPYLFVLAMNILSRMLNLADGRGMFGFHPKCRKIGLTHLSTDYLMIFCKGNIESIIGVLTILDHFYEVSELKLNPSKCEIFAMGIPLRTIEDLQQIIGFHIGSLHVHYLASILKNVEHICSRYFWKGVDKSAAGARVSWENICLSKSDGGLGLKNIKTWNRACLISLIRKILAGDGSLWVAWLKACAFKEQDFWHFQAAANVSWSISRILKSRAEALPILSVGSPHVKEIWDLIRFKGYNVS